MKKVNLTIRPGKTTGPQAAKMIDDALEARGKELKELDKAWGLKRMQLSRWRNGADLSNGSAHLIASILRWLGCDVEVTTR